MYRKIATALAIGLLTATASFAQNDELRAQVENEIMSQGLEVELPADATDEQLGQILTLLQGDTHANNTEKAGEIKMILGTE